MFAVAQSHRSPGVVFRFTGGPVGHDVLIVDKAVARRTGTAAAHLQEVLRVAIERPRLGGGVGGRGPVVHCHPT